MDGRPTKKVYGDRMKKLRLWTRIKARISLFLHTGITTLTVKDGDLIVMKIPEDFDAESVEYTNDIILQWFLANNYDMHKTRIIWVRQRTDTIILRNGNE